MLQAQSQIRSNKGELLNLELKRRHVEKSVQFNRGTFEQIKLKLLSDISERMPAQRNIGVVLQGVALKVQELNEVNQKLKSVTKELGSIRNSQMQVIDELKIQKERLEILESKKSSLRANMELKRDCSEIEAVVESSLALRKNPSPAHETSIAFSGIQQNVGYSKEVVPSESSKALRESLTSNATVIRGLEVLDGARGESISLIVAGNQGEEFSVEIINRGGRSLDVHVLSPKQSERRRLWHTREKIFRALNDAGYVVNKFVLGV